MIKKILFTTGCDRPMPRATLIEWLVSEGDPLEEDSAVCRYEVDKAVTTCNAKTSGYVRRLLASPGTRLSSGTVLALASDAPDEELPDIHAFPPGYDLAEDAFDWSEVDERDCLPEPLGVMRRTIADRMTMSKRFIPCFYLTALVDMTGCLELRATLKQNGEKATFNDMTIKASALALCDNPRVAGIFVPSGFLPRRRINIGFAAALPDDGLVVPVIKDADKKPLCEVARETRELAAKAKKGELVPEDCSGGIFSVSYLGSYDVDNFVAIVNPGEAAILAAGKVAESPVVVAGQVAIRPMMKITLSFDHRSIDGALGARFAGNVKKYLEKPESLL